MDAHWLFMTIEGALLLYIVGRMLSPKGRKKSMTALMQPTALNRLIFALFIITGGIGVVDWLTTADHGSMPSFSLVCVALVGVFGVVLLAMNLAKAQHTHPRT